MGLLKEDDDVMCSTIWILVLFQRNLTPTCVFWDVGSKGKWCEVVKGEHQTTCLCDHLTFFAVLMVSLLQLLQLLISQSTMLFLLLRKKQRDHIVYVHMNLLWGIFLLDMSFLIAVPLAPTGGDMACKAGGMFLHFGVLACLTWMAIEGYSLYRLVIEVFNSYVKHLLLKLCLVGWGEWQKLWGNKRVGFDRFGPVGVNCGSVTPLAMEEPGEGQSPAGQSRREVEQGRGGSEEDQGPPCLHPRACREDWIREQHGLCDLQGRKGP
uniref:Adhesion G protein-coupled receptor G1 n=1 Tax=Pseudonaja textilis TaxID=8673 RepID=A0A670YCY7_PSETE